MVGSVLPLNTEQVVIVGVTVMVILFILNPNLTYVPAQTVTLKYLEATQDAASLASSIN